MAGGVLGLSLFAAASLLLVRVPLREPKAVTLVYVLAAACSTGGVMFFAFVFRLASTRVDLCTGGFRYYSSRDVVDVTWDEVDLIQIHVQAEGGAHVDPSMTVSTVRGRAFHFTANHVTRLPAFGKVLAELTAGTTTCGKRRRR